MSEDSKISSMDTTFQAEVERQLSQVPVKAAIYTRLLSGEPEATLVFLGFNGVLLPRQAPRSLSKNREPTAEKPV